MNLPGDETNSSVSTRPLSGIRVLDFSHVLAGPFCAYQLAVLGADVIKIESPERPDMMRLYGPDYDFSEQCLGIHYLAQAAGKKSLGIDLQKQEGQQIIQRLVRDADVLVENYRVGVMEKLNLGYKELSAINPALIYCSISGFGRTGPKAQDPAYDNVIQAYSGMMYASGTEQSDPVKVGPPVLDYGTGAQAALAILAALYQCKTTGKGQQIDVSMLDAALMLMSNVVAEAGYLRSAPHRGGNSSHVIAGYGEYRCLDDQRLVVGAFTPAQNACLWSVLGDAETAAEVTDMNYRQLEENIAPHRQELQRHFLLQTASYWEETLNSAGVPAARVRQLDETLASEQVKSRQVIADIESPFAKRASIAVPVCAFSMSGSELGIEQTAPEIAQHNEEILTNAGYSRTDIERFRREAVLAPTEAV